MPTVLIFGATGLVGSATLRVALDKGHTAYAFVRTPSKIPASLASRPECKIIQGDASSVEDVRSAVHQDLPVEAVVIAAPCAGALFRDGVYEQININIIKAVQAEQRESGRKIRVWVMMSQAVMEHPARRGVYLRRLLPITAFPEYEPVVEFLEKEGGDVFWTINCPGIVSAGAPCGPLVESITTPPQWRNPFPWTRVVPFGLGFNAVYNWLLQRISAEGLGGYMTDNLGFDERLRGRRVAVVEDSKL